MILENTLKSIGKSTFVKYYYNFKNHTSAYCVANFTENYTDNTKKSRTSSSQSIFREGLEQEALKLIMNSKKVDAITHERAKEILKNEFSPSS